MPLGEVFLGAFLGAILKALISPDLVRFLRQEGFETKINKWGRTLEIIIALLQDAEEKRLTDKAVQIWLDDLEELAYDAEDMLDEFEYEATARKLKMAQLQSSKFWKHIPGGFCNWSLDSIRFRFRMCSKVKRVTTRFNQLCELRGRLGLQVITGGASSTSSSAAPQRPQTSGHRTERAVYGRDADKEKILEMLFKNESTDDNILVIPIVGMGGVGKTTLAREVYHNVVESYEVEAWVCVSDGEFDVTRISKSILENITGSSSLLNDLATIQDKLKEQVVGKKLLLVLDDVWNSVYGKWEILQSPLTASAVGSRILVTTRDEGVALRLRPSGFHRLDLLQREDCWLVFSMCAFENGVIPAHHQIKLIQEKVMEKSKGLPLAAKTLGGLLRSEHIDGWLGMLNNKLWDLSEKDGSEIPAALKVSYHHLPPHLRRCFAYCTIFPKDYEFESEEVVLLWIAEGLVQQSTTNEQLEELGYRYFCDLLGRSMFQQSSSSNGYSYVMHDLVHDLAQWALGERGLRLDGASAANRQSKGLKKVRHFSYTSGEYDGKKRFKVLQELEDLKVRIRAFLPISQDNQKKYITSSIPFTLLPKFKRLRVLSLQSYCIAKVPIPIGSLKHLRYLNLSRTMVRSLPESICLLYNLQILMLRDCSRLVKLPSNFKYLIKLCHLDIKGAILIKKMPLGMKDLKNLHSLSNFIVGKDMGSSLKDLISLKMLRGELCIMKLDNVIDCDYKDPILRDKDLKELLLEWGSHFHESRSEVVEEKVLDMLQPHENLQELTITCYGGTKFPSWVGDSLYSNMKVLRLKNCERCTYLSSLGLLVSLEELSIEGMKRLTRIDSKFYGKGRSKPFKSLKTLCFEDMVLWADWEPIEENEDGDAFPCLEMLSIKNCPLLSGSLPRHLFALEELVVENCKQLVVSFSNIPELCKIKIDGCKRISCQDPTEFKSIRYLSLVNISEFSNQLMQECFGKVELQQVKHSRSEMQLDEPPLGGLQSIRFLTEMVISNCSNIVSFPEVCSLPHLSKLEIQSCDALISLPEGMKITNVCLESLEISFCDSLAFIVSGQLPPSLKRLQISNCKKLETLWGDRESDQNTNSSLLESLDISSCHSLASIVRGQLPPSLKRLEIKHCKKLESLWDDREGTCSSRQGKDNGNNTNSSLLDYLSVWNCPSLTCLSSIIELPATLKHLEFGQCQHLTELSQSGQLPASLKYVSFYWCPQLTTIAEQFLYSNTSVEVISICACENLQIPSGLHNLRHLRELSICDCPSIERFPVEGLADTSLRQLEMRNCEKLKALPFGLRRLSSLEDLRISECPSITSFKPEEEFPTNLKSLQIVECMNVYRPLVQWGLQNLTSLTSLQIWECPDVESFPQQEMGMMLPPSLTGLKISTFPKLKQLWSEGFQNLTSLQSLSIRDCTKLTSLGDQGLPSSLESLSISGCRDLKCFPKQGLPSSLQRLDIWGCDRLKEECKRNKGREWSKISSILEVRIDNKHIFELEEGEEPQSSLCYSSCLANCHPMHCCKVLR